MRLPETYRRPAPFVRQFAPAESQYDRVRGSKVADLHLVSDSHVAMLESLYRRHIRQRCGFWT